MYVHLSFAFLILQKFSFFLPDGNYGGGGGQGNGGYGQNTGYNQSWNNQSQGGWSSDYGNAGGYGSSYGGGPMRGGNNYTHRSGGPYGGKPSWPAFADSLLTLFFCI